jgi:2-methylcitrate dehydratase PrpD
MDDFPTFVRQAARRSQLNGIGAALGSARDPHRPHARTKVLSFSDCSHAMLIGRRQRIDAGSAAFLSAMASNLLDFDDTYLRPSSSDRPGMHWRNGADCLARSIV